MTCFIKTDFYTVKENFYVFLVIAFPLLNVFISIYQICWMIYKKLFEQIIPVDENKFKYLDYTYYNCSEAPDYYVGKDPFEDEI